MAGPHPAVSQARHALAREFAQIPIGGRVLLAVSGGADSMALAASAAFAARARAIQVHSLTVDHGLRPESSQEAEIVVRRLMALGIDARAVHINVAACAGAKSGPEGQARSARYRALAQESLRLAQEGLPHEVKSLPHEQASVQGVPVFLGHNADEQAETVLLGLARGSGARSIAGMPRRGVLPEHHHIPMIRPLLNMRREELRTVCRELGVPWVEDPTNTLESEWRSAHGDPLKRISVRHILMPALENVFGAGIVASLVRTGMMAGDDDAALSTLAEQALEKARVEEMPMRIDTHVLREYPRAIRTRALRQAALAVGARPGELFFQHIAALDKLVMSSNNNMRVDLPGAHAWKLRGMIDIRPGQSPLAMR